ncbi:Aluminum-activated malate transporter 12 [Capsicum baccatum]|uniref:Aluminum-activated malate transporter 12 n=1 Tax=Capsicum baccatum TaxID=33114 RepID=A0A2G2WK20_CAPBA|nr:Aluminum-activated malate transporter 12 [Capsicum baccatum]
MEVTSGKNTSCCLNINGPVEKMKRLPRLTWRKIWKVGKEDKRRVIHSLKVGVALSLVSLLYLMEPLFNGIGENAIWAVMTVVVVLEFTAGATLYKGLNRGLGTVLAGLLAFLIAHMAKESGNIFHATFIGTAVFLVGAMSTYMRFFPHIKKNYDYGVVIFLLTFNLITVSSYRLDSVLKITHERLYTIAIGCGICLLMTLLVFPIWSGEDLHLSTVAKFDGLAKSIAVCINEYFSDNIQQQEKDAENSMEMEDPIYKGYKTVLDSKSSDENLALYASWEPRYLRHCTRYPWHQYVKLGTVLRHFGYTLVALHGCLQTEIKTPQSVRVLFKDPCNRLAGELTKALKELGDSIRNRRKYCPEMLSNHVHEALQDLIDALKSQPRLFLGTNSNTNILLALATLAAKQKSGKDFVVSLSSVNTDSSDDGPPRLGLSQDFLKEGDKKQNTLRPTLSKIGITSLEFCEALPFAAFASLLIEAVARLDLVIEEVVELGKVAHFKEYSHHDDHESINVVVSDNNPRERNEVPSSQLATD